MKPIIITITPTIEVATSTELFRELADIIYESTSGQLERMTLGSGELANYKAEFE